MTKWIYEPNVGVGPFQFGLKFCKNFAGYVLQLRRRESNSIYTTYSDENWPVPLHSELWKVIGSRVCLRFDVNDRLVSIQNSESFIFLGTEIIGLRKNRLINYFGQPRKEMSFENGVVMYYFNGDIFLVTIDGHVETITVKAYSIPFYNRKMFKERRKLL
jgi:hypothetical protein